MSPLFESALISAMLASTIRGTTPILLAALGEAYVERAGLLNLGIEGMMVAGAFSSFVVALNLNNLLCGFLTAAVVGLALGLLFGFLTITLRANQIVVGLGLTIFAHSMSSFLHRVIFGNQFPILFGAGGTHEIPLVSQIPVLGQALFNQHGLVYLTFLMVPLMHAGMYKTRFGLRIRAVGESPWAADAAGVSVDRIRYRAILLGGLMAGLGGAFLALGDLAFFVPDISMGRGYIAIVVVMLGKWNPLKVCCGALLFGMAMALTSTLQVTGIKISPDFILMTPYLVVIVTLLLFARSTNLPSSLCIPYERGQKGQ
ncbi:MAG: ABC transporter permease [Desulfobacterales bacterium]|nr:MAG: ABC transporter permease [Desulfobacterales bacterium]